MNHTIVANKLLQMTTYDLIKLGKYFDVSVTKKGGGYCNKNQIVNRLLIGGAVQREDSTWTCETCTFINENMSAATCSMCGTVREVPVAALPPPRQDMDDSVYLPLTDMPQLCLGTVQGNTVTVRNNITKAILTGYRHIDSAIGYADQVEPIDSVTYLDALRDGISGGLLGANLEREDIWITYKGDELSVRVIEKHILHLNITYIDLLLIHHGCGSQKDYRTLKILLDKGIIKRWGVSNCEDVNKLSMIQHRIEGHPLFANQIQALPPNARSPRGRSEPDLTIKINDLGIKAMLFAPVSGFSTIDENMIHLFDTTPEKIIQYYLTKYIKGTDNVLIVGSVSGRSILLNYQLFNSVIESPHPLINIDDIESNLQKRKFALM